MKVNGYSRPVKRPLVFDLQRYCTHDGPGIRTVVFLKGCPLRCEWCSNPESQSAVREILYDATRCVGCRACLRPEFGGAMHELEGRIVPDRSKPVPRELAGVCPSLALRVAGREVEAEVLVREVLKDRAFFDKSGGGVTFSGGEPLNHPEFLLESIVRFEAEGVSVAIETCLAVEAPVLLPFLGHNIHWLVDVKHTDADKLADKTAGDALAILELVRLIASREAQVTYRVPLIPRFNDSDADRDAILSLIASLERPPSAGVRVDLLPYHDLAAGKYQQLGRANPYTRERIAPLTLESWKNAAATRGIDLSWGG